MTAPEFQAPEGDASWTPTADNINALPQSVRDYIHALETNCDPAGMVADNTIKADTIRALSASNRLLRDAAATALPELPQPVQYEHREPRERYTADQMHAYARAALAAQPQATTGEPDGWLVYLPSEQRQDFYDSQDDAGYLDDVTNHADAVVTPYYLHPVQAPAEGDARDAQEQPFEDWWEREGQFGRAGGGQYEKTFAWNAWCAASQVQPKGTYPDGLIVAALELAYCIANRVPTRVHLNELADEAFRDIGRMVNAQDDGTHGYRLISDALEAAKDCDHALLAVMERAGEGSTVADVLARLSATPSPAPAPVVPSGMVLVSAERLKKAALLARLAADNIVSHSDAGKGMTGWLDDACTYADSASKDLSAVLAGAPVQAPAVHAGKPTAYIQHGRHVESNTRETELVWDKDEDLEGGLFEYEPLFRGARAAGAGWQPIETAPKDGTLILGYCVHKADPYYDGDRLTAYGARVEGLGHVEDGVHAICWEDAREESDGWESPSYTIPAGWVHNADCEQMANPILWMPMPPTPVSHVPVQGSQP